MTELFELAIILQTYLRHVFRLVIILDNGYPYYASAIIRRCETKEEQLLLSEEVVEYIPELIKYIHEPTDKMLISALEQESYLINHINSPSLQMFVNITKKNRYNICYVNDDMRWFVERIVDGDVVMLEPTF